MKISSVIGKTAIVLIVLLMLVTVFSAYDATYGTISALNFSSPQVAVSSQGVYYSVNLSGHNRGFMQTQVQIMNQTVVFPPGVNTSQEFVFPLDSAILQNSSWPVRNASIPVAFSVSLGSYFFNASIPVKENITLDAPFYGFSVTGVSNNTGAGNYTHAIFAEFTCFFPNIGNISNIYVFHNGTRIGSISLPLLVYGSHYDVSGNITLDTSEHSVNLQFRAGTMSWMVNNVSI